MKFLTTVLVLFLILLFDPTGLTLLSITNINKEEHTFNVVKNRNSFRNGPQVDLISSNQKYTDHDPISISSNNQFLSQGFPGSGTSEDPYRIEGFHFTISTGDTIAISDTTAYFVIKNNYLEGVGSASWAIFLNNVEHGIIENNIAVKHDFCIVLYSSHHITFLKNTLSDNSAGIHMESSDNNDISNNKISNTRYYAVYFDEDSDNNIVTWNQFIGNNDELREQASDDGQNNQFKNNHWNDWVSPDINSDGIVDTVYSIDGDANNQDTSPRVTLGSYSLKVFNINLNVLAGTIFLVIEISALVVLIRKQT